MSQGHSFFSSSDPVHVSLPRVQEAVHREDVALEKLKAGSRGRMLGTTEDLLLNKRTLTIDHYY